MDVDKLQELAEKYPEVGELLKDNYSLSVAVLSARMDAWQQKTERRLEDFDSNHTSAQARLVERIQSLEGKLDRVVARLAKRFEENEKNVL